MACTIEGCHCAKTNQPITDVVYGEKVSRRSTIQQIPREHTTRVWTTLSEAQLKRLCRRFPGAYKFLKSHRKALEGALLGSIL